MRNITGKWGGLLAVCLLLMGLAVLSGPAAARADTYATYGNAITDTTFYVTAAGPATVTLSQSGMGLVEKYYIYNNATTSTEYTYAQYTVLYKGNMDVYWQQGAFWNEKTCVLNFYRADEYTVRILPTNVVNMQSSQISVWRNSQWLTVPAWYASGVRNCTISAYSAQELATATPKPTKKPTPKPTKKPTATPTAEPVITAPVTVIFQDIDGNYMGSDVRYLTPGSHTVKPERTFANYKLVGNAAYSVNVYYNGTASPSSVIFLYQYNPPTPKPTAAPTRKPTATPKPTKRPTSVPIKGKIVTPVGWDTQFKPETSSHNPRGIEWIGRLGDNDRSTVFRWTVWTSEWKDDIPEITAYFNGDTVGAIGIRNGNCSSASNYKADARGYNWKVRVWNMNGNHSDTTVTLSDSFSTEYQVVALKKVYKNVDRIEIFLNKYRIGGTNTNSVAISDIRFYTEK
ncbi:MAG: hypothetical protein IJ662_07375 [Clostridia bacterium]|nr:hypothetical protein [Clostridia bacterium]